MIIKLAKPITVGEGDAKKALEQIDMKLDELTGADIQMCVREATDAKGELVRVLVMDVDFHVQLASHSSGVAVADIRRLGGFDFVQVVTAVQGFLTGSI